MPKPPYKYIEDKTKWYYGLRKSTVHSCRIGMKYYGIESKEQLKATLFSGGLKSRDGIGDKTCLEVARWLNMEEEYKQSLKLPDRKPSEKSIITAIRMLQRQGYTILKGEN